LREDGEAVADEAVVVGDIRHTGHRGVVFEYLLLWGADVEHLAVVLHVGVVIEASTGAAEGVDNIGADESGVVGKAVQDRQ